MPDTITFKIKRQDSENTKPYWETFVIPHIPNSNVISCLMDIQANPENSKGEKVAPVVWECNCLEEVCGSCTMVINGKGASVLQCISGSARKTNHFGTHEQVSGST